MEPKVKTFRPEAEWSAPVGNMPIWYQVAMGVFVFLFAIAYYLPQWLDVVLVVVASGLAIAYLVQATTWSRKVFACIALTIFLAACGGGGGGGTTATPTPTPAGTPAITTTVSPGVGATGVGVSAPVIVTYTLTSTGAGLTNATGSFQCSELAIDANVATSGTQVTFTPKDPLPESYSCMLNYSLASGSTTVTGIASYTTGAGAVTYDAIALVTSNVPKRIAVVSGVGVPTILANKTGFTQMTACGIYEQKFSDGFHYASCVVQAADGTTPRLDLRINPSRMSIGPKYQSATPAGAVLRDTQFGGATPAGGTLDLAGISDVGGMYAAASDGSTYYYSINLAPARNLRRTTDTFATYTQVLGIDGNPFQVQYVTRLTK